MTLPELKSNIRRAHKPEAETHVIDFIYDIKSWIEPCLNPIKNHIYPHTYKFTKVNGEVVMKYKQWATDETWLPEGPGEKILAEVPKGAPSIVRPDTNKMLEVKALAECVKKCKRLNAEQREWWAEFIDREKRYREKWSNVDDKYLNNAKKQKWYLDKLRKHKPIEELQENDPDQEEREAMLDDLLKKANNCPKVL